MVVLTRSVAYYATICQKVSLRPTMRRLMLFRHRTAVVVLLLAACAFVAEIRKMQRIPTGNWGGQHINIKVNSQCAAIEYDCATGTIKGPLIIDRNGSFNLQGTHRMERGGPVRAGDTPR